MKILRAFIKESLFQEAKAIEPDPVKLRIHTKEDKEMLREYLRYNTAMKEAKRKVQEISDALQLQFEEKLHLKASVNIDRAKRPEIQRKVEAWMDDNLGELEEGIDAILVATVRIDGTLIKLTKKRKKGSMAYSQILKEVTSKLTPKMKKISDAVLAKHTEVKEAGVEIVDFGVVEEGVMDTIKGWLGKLGSWFKGLTSYTYGTAATANQIASMAETMSGEV